jgi:hypothetical protein
LVASNNISACYASTTISVQNEIGPITLVNKSKNIEVTIPANFTLQFASGSNLTVKVLFDGKITHNFDIDEANNTIKKVTHT